MLGYRAIRRAQLRDEIVNVSLEIRKQYFTDKSEPDRDLLERWDKATDDLLALEAPPPKPPLERLDEWSSKYARRLQYPGGKPQGTYLSAEAMLQFREIVSALKREAK